MGPGKRDSHSHGQPALGPSPRENCSLHPEADFVVSASVLPANAVSFLLWEGVGPALPSAVSSSAIGSFREDAELFLYDLAPLRLRAGALVKMHLRFTPSMRIEPYETITIRLPGFTVDDPASWSRDMFFLTAPLTWEALEWHAETEQLLIMLIDEALPAHQEVTVDIYGSAGFRLPHDGVRVDQPSITIATNAAAGPVIPTGLRVHPGVGSFTDTAVLALEALPVAGETQNVTLSFVPEMGLVTGDSIRVRLSYFTGTSGARPVFGRTGAKFSAEWTLAQELLTVTVTEPIASHESVELSVPVTLPLRGITLDSPSYLIAADAVGGSVLAEPFLHVDPVGRSVSFAIDFSVKRPGAPVDVLVTMQYTHPFLADDSLTLVLPGLELVDALNGAVTVARSAVGSFVVEHWEPQYSEVTVKCTSQGSSGCGTRVDLTIAGLQLPDTPLAANDAGFTATAAVAKAPMRVPISADTIPPAGLLSRSLEFDMSRERPGHADALLVRFTPTFEALTGEHFEIALPGYTAASSTVEVGGRSAATFGSEAVWNATAERLNLTVVGRLSPGETVDLRIANDPEGLQVPADGVVRDDAAFAAAFWVHGRRAVIELPFERVDSLGVFRRSSVEFVPRDIPGSPTLVNIGFQFTEPLEVGARIAVLIPGGFSSELPEGQALTHVSTSPAIAAVGWNSTTALLVLDVAGHAGPGGVPAMENVSVSVWKLRLPALRDENETVPEFLDAFSGGAARMRISLLGGTGFRDVRVSAGLDLYNMTLLNTYNLTSSNATAASRRLLAVQSTDESTRIAVLSPAPSRAQPVNQVKTEARPPARPGQPAAAPAPPTPRHERVQGFLDTSLRAAQRNSAVVRGAAGVRAALRAGTSLREAAATGEESFVATPHVAAARGRGAAELAAARRSGAVEPCSTVVSDSRIEYSPAAVGSVVRITMEFNLHDLSVNQLTFQMPQLTRAGYTNPNPQVTFSNSEFSVGYWEEDTKRLTAIAWTSVTARRQTLVVELSQGLALVPEGAKWNMTEVAFLFLAAGVEGFGCEVPFDYSLGVGSFLTSELVFLPGVPGVVNGLDLAVSVAMPVLKGETISLKFSGFGGDASTGTPVIGLCETDTEDKEMELATATWDPFSQYLVLTISRSDGISAGVVCHFIVDERAGVQVPITGILPDTDANIGLEASAAAGSVLPGLTLVSNVRAVGSLLSHFMHYIPDADSVEVRIDVGFLPAMRLVPGDSIVLTLPGFTGESTDCVRIDDAASSPRGSITLASWSSEDEELTLQVRRAVQEGTNVTVLVPAAAGVILPAKGVLPNEPSLLIRVEALNGNAAPVSVELSDAVGSFLDSPRLTYAPGIAGVNGSVTLSFRAEMQLEQGENIVVTLPDFGGPLFHVDSTYIDSNPQGAIESASWDVDEATLIFVIAYSLSERTEVTILVPETLGITLPVNGLQQNQLSLKISTDAKNGPVQGYSIPNSQPVGSFASDASPRLDFVPGRTGEPVTMTFRFVAQMGIVEMETITLTLPGFSAGEDIDSLSIFDATNSGRFAASWSEKGSQLTLTFNVALQAGIPQIVTVPVDNGIQLPQDGVTLDSALLQISCNAARGPVPSIPVAFSQAVGVFYERHLAFNPPVASSVVSVSVRFQLNRKIMPGETVSVTLNSRSGFFGKDACGTFVLPSDETFMTSGQNASSFPTVRLERLARRVVFTAVEEVSPFAQVNLVVPEEAGIFSPDCGIRDNQPNIVVETDAAAGPVMPVPMSSAGLGSFRDTELFFDPPRVDALTQITVRFRPTMDLELGSTITLALPGFTAADQMMNVSSVCCATKRDCIRRATWNSTTSMLELTVTEAVIYEGRGAFCPIEVLIHRAYEIRIPAEGTQENSARMTIACNSPDGAVLPTAVMRSPGVYVEGGLLYSSISFNGDANGPSATNFTDIVIRIQARMLFYPYDHIHVFLPGFRGPEIPEKGTAEEIAAALTTECAGCGEASIVERASWNTSDSTLVLTVARVLDARQVLEFRSRAAFAALPPDGLRPNQTTIVLASNASAGPFSLASVSEARAVGAFYNSSVDFTPLRAAPVVATVTKSCCSAPLHSRMSTCCVDTSSSYTGAAVTVSFRAAMRVAVGESVEFNLCRFYSLIGSWIFDEAEGRFRVEWDQQRERLILTVLKEAVEAYTHVNVTIGPEHHLLPPPQGVYQNRQCIQVRSSAVDGPVPWTRTVSAPLVGAVWNTSLSFDEPEPGRATGIWARFTLKMPLAAGEAVVLHLPEFTGGIRSCESTEALPVGVFGESRWELNSKTLTVDVLAPVTDETHVEIFVPSTSVVRLPELGISPGDDVFVEVKADSGPVLPTRVSTLPTIAMQGQFLEAALDYDKPRRLVDVEIRFLFKMDVSLFVNDTITLYLPKFTGASGTFKTTSSLFQEHVMTGAVYEANFPVIQDGSWDSKRQELQLLVASEIRALTGVKVLVPSSFGIQLPPEGIFQDSPSLRIAADARAGPAAPAPIPTSTGLGGFQGLSLEYDPPRAGAVANITFRYVPMMVMDSPDVLTLTLPGFTGPPYSSAPMSPPFGHAYWTAATFNLTVTLMQSTEIFSDQAAIFPDSLGVQLPAFGIVANSPTLLVSSNAARGQVVPTVIPVSPPIGYFEEPRLFFTMPRIASGETTVFTFKTVVQMAIKTDETVTLHLPGFFIPGGDKRFRVSASLLQRFNWASWSAAAQTLTMTCLLPVPKGYPIEESILAETDFRIPMEGIRNGTHIYKVSALAYGGNVLPTPLLSMPSVGALRYSRLQFSTYQPGAPADVLLSFVPDMNLVAGTNVTFHLPGFSVDTAEPVNVTYVMPSPPVPAIGAVQIFQLVNKSTSSFSRMIDVIVVPITGTIPRLTLLKVSIPQATSRLVLPTEGLRANSQSRLTFRTVQPWGSVAQTPIRRVPGIYAARAGAFLHTHLSFARPSRERHEPRANDVAHVTLNFTTSMDLMSGDTLVVHLPGFRVDKVGPVTAHLSHGVPPVYPGKDDFHPMPPTALAADWDAESATLSLTLPADVHLPGEIFVLLEVREEERMLLPLIGLKANQADLKVRCSAQAGSVLDAVSIQETPAVGSFALSTSLKLAPLPLRHGTPATVTFAFSPKMVIETGETVTLTLPGFRAENASHVYVTTNRIHVWRAVEWKQGEAKLLFTVNTTLQIHDDLEMVIEGLTLPETGVRLNQESIAISSDAVDGPVIPTPLISTQQVGSFTNTTSLAFEPSQANTPVNITFGFVPEMELLPGDTLQLVLPNFYRICNSGPCSDPAPPVNVVSDPPGAMMVDEWDEAVGMLTLRVLGTVPRRHAALLTVLSGAGMHLPSLGLLSGDPALTVQANASRGPLPVESIHVVPGVASFTSAALSWDPPRISSATAIILNFTATTAMEPGDKLTLFLPSLERNSTAPVQVLSTMSGGTSGLFSGASWVPDPASLVFTVGSPIPFAANIELRVPASEQIILPSTGVARDSQSLLIALDSVYGRIIPAAVFSTLAVGAMDHTSLTFAGTPRADSPVHVKVTYLPTMDLGAGTSVTIVIPGFRRPSGLASSYGIKADDNPRAGTVTFDEERFQLVITITDSGLDGGTLVEVDIPEEFGFIAAEDGIRKDDPSYTIATDSPTGVVLPTPFLELQPIGKFAVKRIAFDPPVSPSSRIPVKATITGAFEPLMFIAAGEAILVNLVGFNAPSGQIYANVTPAGVFETVWDQAASRLSFVAGSGLGAAEMIEFSIPATSGFSLPAQGALLGTVTIETDTVAGVVYPTDFDFTPVGSFTDTTRISFANPIPGNQSDITFSFSATMPIAEREFVALSLPHFTGIEKEIEVFSTPPGYFRTAFWSAGLDRLEFPAFKKIPPNTEVSIFVPANHFDFRIPLRGISYRNTSYTITTEAETGSVLPTPLWDLPALGSLLGTSEESSRIMFGTPHAHTHSNIWLWFTPRMMIAMGETVSLHLPGFSLEYLAPPNVSVAFPTLLGNETNGTNATNVTNMTWYVPIEEENPEVIPNASDYQPFSNASWDSETSTITFIAAEDVPRDTRVLIFVPRLFGMVLPYFGVRFNAHCIDQDQAACTLCQCENHPISTGAVPAAPAWCDPMRFPSISSNARDGPFNATEVFHTPAIGALGGTRIDFDVLAAGVDLLGEGVTVNNMTLSFAPFMPLAPGDHITMMLPDFTGASFTDAPLSPEPEAGTATWDLDEMLLTITIGRCSGRERDFAVKFSGIQMPDIGLTADQDNLLIGTDAAAGPVALLALESTPGVGSFFDTAVKYDPPKILQSIEILLDFTADMKIQAGEYLVLRVPSLEGDEQICDMRVLSEPPGIFEVAYWTGSDVSSLCTGLVLGGVQTKSYALKLATTIERGTPVFARIGDKEVRTPDIPEMGTDPNDPRIKLWTNAIEAPIAPFPAHSVIESDAIQEVGLLESMEMTFDVGSSGQPSGIDMTFSFDVLLWENDAIDFVLKGFSQKNGYDIVSLSLTSFAITSTGIEYIDVVTGSWSESGERLVLTVNEYLPSLTDIVVSIALENDIRLPETGVHMDSELLLSADLLAGPVGLQEDGPVELTGNVKFFVQPVGAFYSSELTFSSAAAPNSLSSLPAVITFDFECLFSIVPGDVILLRLPGFTSSSSAMVNFTVDTDDAFTDATWEPARTQLSFTASGDSSSLDSISLTVPSSVGIRLPSSGVRAEATRSVRSDQDDLIVGSQSEGGVVPFDPPTPVRRVNPVGSFTESTNLTFTLPKAEEVTGMSFGFTPLMEIASGETVTLHLPGFYGDSSESAVNSTGDAVDIATWNNVDETLEFFVGRTIAPNEEVHVDVPSELGIHVPIDGVRWKQLTIGLSSSAADGPVAVNPLTPIIYTQPVGDFGTSSAIQFEPAMAGSPTRITLNFRPRMRLAPEETITFVLPLIIGDSAVLCIGPAPGYDATFEAANWSLATSELILTVAAPVDADEHVSVVVPSSAGLTLPAAGFPADWANFTVSVDALEGPILVTPSTSLAASQPVGVLNDTRLVLDPGCPGEPASMNLSFLPTMNIEQDARFTLAVPGLNRAVFNCTELRTDADGFERCVGEWTCIVPSLCSGTVVAVTASPAGAFEEARWEPRDATIVQYRFPVPGNGTALLDVSELRSADALVFEASAPIPRARGRVDLTTVFGEPEAARRLLGGGPQVHNSRLRSCERTRAAERHPQWSKAEGCLPGVPARACRCWTPDFQLSWHLTCNSPLIYRSMRPGSGARATWRRV